MTYSIVARDPAKGELGIAVQSRFFAAGRDVPWIESGVGAIASQSFASPIFSYETLQMLHSGMEPQQLLDRFLSEDPANAFRQVVILDMHGRIAAHTGAKCASAAGHAVGENCCAQANMMTHRTMCAAMVQAFEKAKGEMADRLLASMEAAEREGGEERDRRAASIVVVSGTPCGEVKLDRLVDLRVDDHLNPVGEIKRLLRYSRVHHRYDRTRSKAFADDFTGALADLDSCYAANPNKPEFLFRQAMVL